MNEISDTVLTSAKATKRSKGTIALLAVMAVMGAMILAGFGFVGLELYNRVNHPERTLKARIAAHQTDRKDDSIYSVIPPKSVSLGLAKGSHIEAIQPVANRLAVLVRHADGKQQILLFSPSLGRIETVLAP